MSKAEYSEMEKRLRSDTALMEKKYRKAKKLIRQYQHRYCMFQHWCCKATTERAVPFLLVSGSGPLKGEANV